jgi:DNA replication protein DnaC
MTIKEQNLEENRIIALSQGLRLLSFSNYKESIKQNESFETNLLTLLQLENLRRSDRRLIQRLKASRFPVIKTIDTFEMDPTLLPHVNFDEIKNHLLSCNFINMKEDVVALGPPGHGKTHLASAVGYEAVKRGYKVLFKQADTLVIEMNEAKTEKNLNSYIKKILKVDLLILDELGYLSYGRDEANLLFEIITSRYETGSTFFTTNREFDKWGDFIDDKDLVCAIVDRLGHHSIILNMNGPKGYRLLHARSRKSSNSY